MREALTQDHLPFIVKLNPGCSSRNHHHDHDHESSSSNSNPVSYWVTQKLHVIQNSSHELAKLSSLLVQKMFKISKLVKCFIMSVEHY